MSHSGASLAGIRILDLSRVLAGPSCTQLLGDLGAEVIKVERPAVGDETRTWGPPYVKDAGGSDTTESGYYLCCNRNKRSVAIDFSKPEGVALVKQLLQHCDVLIENFKLGGLGNWASATTTSSRSIRASSTARSPDTARQVLTRPGPAMTWSPKASAA